MSRRLPKHTRPILPTQLREAVLQVAGEHLPLGIEGRELDDPMVWAISMYASVNQMTIESACHTVFPGSDFGPRNWQVFRARLRRFRRDSCRKRGATQPEYLPARNARGKSVCQELERAPSGNTVREHLSEVLDNRRRQVIQLEGQLNAALAGQLPRRMRRRLQSWDFEIAIDLHAVPYHGQPELSEEEVRRGPAKSGTTHFHSYATLAIVHDGCRYELALTFVWADETLAEVVERLIRLGKRLKLRIRRAYLDKAFCGRAVFAVLRAHRLPYLIPVPLRGKRDDHGVYQGGIGRLFTGRRSDYTRYTFNAGKPEAHTTDVAIVRTYSHGRYGRHHAARFAYAVCGLEHIPPNQIVDLYRRRFGIESGYRQVEQLRARTASPSPALRLLLMGLALILLKVYMTVRQFWLTVRRYGSRVRRIWLTLRRLTLLLSRLLEQGFGVIPIEQCLGAEAIS